MRAIRNMVVAGTVAAALSALGLGFGAGVASADPASAPSLTTLTGVGSDTVTPLFDNGNPGGQTGTFVHDYNSKTPPPTFPVASWDAVNPATGGTGDTITTKALNSGDTSCQLVRPDGSSAGIAALNQGQTDTNTVTGQSKIYCIDYARSSRAPNTTTDDDAFVQFAKDAIAWSHPKISGTTSPEPASLTFAQLQNIYNCVDTNWNQVGGKNAPIAVVVPQNGSGTRSTWLGALGITATSEPCWQNGTVVVGGTTDVIEENTGLSPGNVAQFTTTQSFGTTCSAGCPPQDDIFPYSIGDNIAQGPLSKGVGGHANSIWGHGNLVLASTANAAGVVEKPTAKNSKGQVVINPAFYTTAFGRVLYGVTRNSCVGTSKGVCLPTTTPPTGGVAYPAYEATGLSKFFGTSGWVCTNSKAKADIISYGFTGLPTGSAAADCGFLTAGD